MSGKFSYSKSKDSGAVTSFIISRRGARCSNFNDAGTDAGATSKSAGKSAGINVNPMNSSSPANIAKEVFCILANPYLMI